MVKATRVLAGISSLTASAALYIIASFAVFGRAVGSAVDDWTGAIGAALSCLLVILVYAPPVSRLAASRRKRARWKQTRGWVWVVFAVAFTWAIVLLAFFVWNPFTGATDARFTLGFFGFFYLILGAFLLDTNSLSSATGADHVDYG